jgi:hypothetical protein
MVQYFPVLPGIGDVRQCHDCVIKVTALMEVRKFRYEKSLALFFILLHCGKKVTAAGLL